MRFPSFRSAARCPSRRSKSVHGSAHVEEVPEGTPRLGRSPSAPFESTEEK